MLQNNNQGIIKRLNRRILKVNKMRNLFAILGIALTTLLITTTVTAGITFYNTNKAYMNVSSAGVDSDGYINITNEGLEKLKSISNVDKIGVDQLASLEPIKNGKLLNEQVFLEAPNDKITYDMMAVIPIEGDYPKTSDEVLVPTWVLDLLGVDKKISENIKLDVMIDGSVKTLDLKLCGYYESLVTRGSGRTRIFVSKDFISKYNSGITNVKGTKTAFITLKNIKSNYSFDEVNDQFKKVADEIGSSQFKVHPKYENEKVSFVNSDVIKQGVAIGFAVLLVIITGYLIIYNIFYISVTRDIKFYGLLKTIGTTSKQLKKIIIRQALTLSIIAIPIGLILGYLVASFIIPMALSFTIFANIVVVSKSIYIFVLSIIFSLITVFISCSKPRKIAGKVSPIEAVKFVSCDLDNSKKKIKKGANGAKINRMAWSNIVKSKKKVILSIFSISFSAVIVIFTINTSMGIDPEKHANNQMNADVSINNNIGHFWGEKEYQPISKELVDKIKDLDVVDNVKSNHSAVVPEKDGKVYDFGVDLLLRGKLKDEFEIGESKGNNNIRYSKISPAENLIKTELAALNSDSLDRDMEKLKVIDGKIDKEEFKKGNYIIFYASSGSTNVLKAGDDIELRFNSIDKDGKVKEIKKDFKVMAIVTNKSDKAVNTNLEALNIEEEQFKSLFPDYKNYIKSLDIDLKDNINLKDADKKIEKIINESGNNTLGMISKNFYIEGLKEIKAVFIIIGIIISSILGVIGVINVINTMLTSIFSRRIEFAMLESIGMTKKQLKKMILFEGIYYILISALVIIPLGFLAAYIAPMMLPIYGGVNYLLYLISVIVVILIIAVIMLITPLLGYKFLGKDSLVERLKIIE